MRSNRRLAVALVAVLAGGSLAACSSGGGDDAAKLDLKTGTNSPLTITAAQLAGLAQGGAVVDVKPTPDGTVEAAKGGALVFKPKAGFKKTGFKSKPKG